MRDVPERPGSSRRDTPFSDTPALEKEIDRDLKDLAERSRGDIPPLSSTIHALAGARPAERREDGFMALFTSGTRRPRLAAVAGVAVLAAAFLLVPFSYTKTVGHQVALEMAGVSPEQGWVRDFAKQLKASLGAEGVQVRVDDAGDGPSLTLMAQVGPKEGAFARQVAESYVRKLAGHGVTAHASVEPVRKKVSGSLYAMAVDNVISVNVDGKTAEEIEAEIASRLAEAGLSATVSVEKSDSQMKVQIRAEHDGPVEEGSAPPELELTSGGEAIGGDVQDVRCKVLKHQTPDGLQVTVEVSRSGQTYTATVENADALSEADLAARIQQILADQGVNLSVSVDGGRIQVLDPAGSNEPATGGTRETSWGKLKAGQPGN
jgi:hypothetical protein